LIKTFFEEVYSAIRQLNQPVGGAKRPIGFVWPGEKSKNKLCHQSVWVCLPRIEAHQVPNQYNFARTLDKLWLDL
jgi:hypothetical protein